MLIFWKGERIPAAASPLHLEHAQDFGVGDFFERGLAVWRRRARISRKEFCQKFGRGGFGACEVRRAVSDHERPREIFVRQRGLAQGAVFLTRNFDEVAHEIFDVAVFQPEGCGGNSVKRLAEILDDKPAGFERLSVCREILVVAALEFQRQRYLASPDYA